MHRLIAVGIGALVLGLAASCSSSSDDDDNDNNNDSTGSVRTGQGGSPSQQAGTQEPEPEASGGRKVQPSGGSPPEPESETGGSTSTARGGSQPRGGSTSTAIEMPPCESLEGLPSECGKNQNTARMRQVNMLLVVDKSGSMTQTPTGFDLDKWSAMKQALAEVLMEKKDVISFGLVLFPSAAVTLECRPTACCTVGSSIDVGIGSGEERVNEILDRLAATNPGGGTPAADGLRIAYEYYSGAGSSLVGDKYVLLATDGGPNCNPDLSCEMDKCTINLDENEGLCPNWETENCCTTAATRLNCLDDERVIQQIEALRELGVTTIVVGIPGTEAYKDYLSQFAQAGGKPVPGDVSYYQVTAEAGVQGLVDTFRQITIDLVKSCEVELPEAPEDVNKFNIAVDCKVITKSIADDGSGWELSEDQRTVTLTGNICEQIRTEGVQRIDWAYGCATVL